MAGDGDTEGERMKRAERVTRLQAMVDKGHSVQAMAVALRVSRQTVYTDLAWLAQARPGDVPEERPQATEDDGGPPPPGVRGTSELLTALATEAHLALRLGWPHHARQAARRAEQQAAALVVELADVCAQVSPHDERRARAGCQSSAIAEAADRAHRHDEPPYEPPTQREDAP